MKTKITTDNKWRDFVCGYEVPAKVLKSDFDYLDDAEDSCGFLKYKGDWYHTSQFMRGGIPGWDGSMGWSYSNGLLIKISSDGEQYKVAYYYTAASAD